jgi:CDP-glucose 4,6-dehydratase
LVPDIIKAFARQKPVTIRSPHAIRPWQHTLEPLAGYLSLGQTLLNGRKDFAAAWNFGPSEDSYLPVGDLLHLVKTFWEQLDFDFLQENQDLHEASMLRLDSTKASLKLNWKPVWNLITGIQKTIEWYREFYESGNIISRQQLDEYVLEAKHLGLGWSAD